MNREGMRPFFKDCDQGLWRWRWLGGSEGFLRPSSAFSRPDASPRAKFSTRSAPSCCTGGSENGCLVGAERQWSRVAGLSQLLSPGRGWPGSPRPSESRDAVLRRPPSLLGAVLTARGPEAARPWPRGLRMCSRSGSRLAGRPL